MQTLTQGPGAVLSESEMLSASEASLDRLFESVEQRLRKGRSARQADPRYLKAFGEVAGMYRDALSGNRYKRMVFAEAMKTSDFTYLFGDVLQRQMLDMYDAAEVDHVAYAKQGIVPDFRTVRRIAVDGATAPLRPVAQGDPYGTQTLSETEYDYSVGKYGETAPYTWEMMINDDLDALRTLPIRFATAARYTEDKFATDLYTHYYLGYNPTFFSTGNKNLLTGANSALSVASLEAAMTLLGQQRDAKGSPIIVKNLTLVVPPALEVTARNLLEATAVLIATGSSSSTSNQLTAPNWMRQKISTLVVNYWFPIVMGDNEGQSTWFLFADPRNGGRPAMEIGKLLGHEKPELFMKAPDAQRIGGGLAGVEDGSFSTDGIDIKVRHVVGGTLLDHRVAVAASGTAS